MSKKLLLLIIVLCLSSSLISALNVNITQDTRVSSTPSAGSADSDIYIEQSGPSSRVYFLVENQTGYYADNFSYYVYGKDVITSIVELYYCDDYFSAANLTWANQGTEVTNCSATPFITHNNGNYTAGSWYNETLPAVAKNDSDGIFAIKIMFNPEAGGAHWIGYRSNESGQKPYIQYNNSAIPNASNVTSIYWYSQSPSNVTVLSLFTQDINLTYNYSNTNFSGSASLNLTVYHSEESCYQYSNGTCVKLNNTYSTITQTSNYTSTNYTLISYTLRENDIYPYTENLNYSFFNQTPSAFNLNNANTLISFSVKNVSSNEQFYILEVMGLSSNNLSRVYACNNSYNFASLVTTSNYCSEIGFLSNVYNHSHNSNSNHSLIAFVLNNGLINGAKVAPSSLMHFIISGANTGTHNVSYVNNYSFANATRTSTNGGNSFTSQNYSVNFHLHIYNNSEYYATSAIGNYSGSLNYTSFTSEKIDLVNLPPNPPEITNPFETTQSTRFLNITYTNSTTNIPGATISYYNISLLNSDLTFNRTIQGNNSRNLSYYYDVYYQNLTIGLWYVKVEVTDSNGLKNFDFESFNLTTNAEINVSVFTITGNVSVSNFTGWIYNNATTENNTFNTTAGYELLDIVKGVYQIFVNSESYAITNSTNYYSTNFTNYNTSLKFYLYETNTINVSFYDEETNILVVNNTCTLDLISDLYAANYSTTNGTMYITTLTPEDYILRYTCTGYTIRFYSIEVTNQSYNPISLYVINTSNYANISVYVIDEVARPVENALVKALKYNLDNNTYILQEMGLTDVSGKAILTLSKFDEYYKFIVEYNGETKLTTTPAYITTDSLTLQISFEVDFGTDYYTFKSIDSNVYFNTATDNFRFEFNDASGAFSQFCLYVYQGVNASLILYNSSCTSSSSGTILLGVTPINGTTYTAKAYYNDSGTNVYLSGASYTYPNANGLESENLFFQFLVTLGAALTAVFNIPLAVVLVPASLLLGSQIGLNAFSLNGLIAIQVVGLIIAVLIGLRRSN